VFVLLEIDHYYSKIITNLWWPSYEMFRSRKTKWMWLWIFHNL